MKIQTSYFQLINECNSLCCSPSLSLSYLTTPWLFNVCRLLSSWWWCVNNVSSCVTRLAGRGRTDSEFQLLPLPSSSLLYYCRHDDCNSVVTDLLIELLNIIHNTGPHDIIMILNRRVGDKVHCSGSPDSWQLSNLSTIQFSVSYLIIVCRNRKISSSSLLFGIRLMFVPYHLSWQPPNNMNHSPNKTR